MLKKIYNPILYLMPKKIYKELITYICPECLKNFGNKKGNYLKHINKKNNCVKMQFPTPLIAPLAPLIAHPTPLISDINFPDIPELLDIPLIVSTSQKNPENLQDSINNIEDKKKQKKIKKIELKDSNGYSCEQCYKVFSKKYNLTRHQNSKNSKCKINNNPNIINDKDDIDDKDEIDDIFDKDDKDDKDDIDDEQNPSINLILERLKNLENENKKLKKEIKNKSNVNISQSNYNINLVNNNNNINIINFNDMNYNNIDKKLFIGPILDRRLFGKALILKMIENIYINESLPEYQNLVITDKNRGYVKVFNNGKWKTDNLNIINLVLNGIVEHSKSILDELYDIYLNNNQTTNRLNTSKKYINLCDGEYLEELKVAQVNEQTDNKNEIKRCEEFREMVFKDTINLFHDNKNILLKPKKNIGLIDL